MKRVILLTVIYASIVFPADCQGLKFKPSFSTVLDTFFGRKVLEQCSRSAPEHVKAFWTITHGDIQVLEDNFRKIDSITPNWKYTIRKVDSVERYGFQYLGVIIRGERFIYINAFILEELATFKSIGQDPSEYPVLACDGGDSFWGVLFNIKTKQFSCLAFNGDKGSSRL